MTVTSDRPDLLRVATADLAHGLYVAELDRPWPEVPLMFQGFTIRDDEELAILRRHCSHVYIDPERSRTDVESRLQPSGPDTGQGEQQSEQRQGGQKRADLTDALGSTRQPDKHVFGKLVEEANQRRSEALDYLEQAMQQVKAGESLDTGGARQTVSELAAVVSRNTAASLWLTNLRERDEYTIRHALNVCVLMLTFGVQYRFERSELERLAMGAMLIDVGMTRVPSELLSKNGPLSCDEWEILKRHPEYGAEIVEAAGYVPQEVREIIELHHERLDGSGYPHRLEGAQIPLHARLAGLFDTYDAMTSPRVYQDAMPPDRALQYLHNEADATFGVTPVQQFIRCVGVYPTGSLVQLDNGVTAVVLDSSPEARLRPMVLLVRTPDGEFYDKRVLLNLAAEPERGGLSGRTVRRMLDPVAEGIDVPGIVAFEFGLG